MPPYRPVLRVRVFGRPNLQHLNFEVTAINVINMLDFLIMAIRLFFSWDITNQIFDLENSKSRSWPRTKLMDTFKVEHSMDLFVFRFNGNWTISFIRANYIFYLEKFKVKFMGKVKSHGQIWGLAFNWYVCILFHKNSTIFSCDQAALRMVFSVRLSHLFDCVPITVSSWNFQELSPRTRVRSMQNVKVRAQRSRSQRSRPNLTVSRL